MTLYLSDSSNALSDCVQMNKMNLGMICVNLSPSKTFLLSEGFGEYTSWYIYGDFTSQYGFETGVIKPQGKNPPDDFNAVAKGTAIAMCTSTCNPLGATSRLKLVMLGVRRLWRIKPHPGKMPNMSPHVQLLSDRKNHRPVPNCSNNNKA